MKKVLSCALILCFVITSASVLWAETGPYQKGERGVKKIVKSPLQITDRVKEVSKQHNPLFGITFGFIEGVVTGATQIISGAADIVTSPIGSYDKEMKTAEVTPIKK